MKSPLSYYRIGRLVEQALKEMGYVDIRDIDDLRAQLARYREDRRRVHVPDVPQPRTVQARAAWCQWARQQRAAFKRDHPEFPHE